MEKKPEKTCMCQTEASDEVWDLNMQTETALNTLAILFERFEQVNSDLANVAKNFDKLSVEMQATVDKAKEGHRLAEISAQAVRNSF